MPETCPEGVEAHDFFGFWDQMEDRKEAEFYRVQNGLFEVRQDITNYHLPGCPIEQEWDTPARIDLLTMLQILAHDRETRPEAYQTTAQ